MATTLRAAIVVLWLLTIQAVATAQLVNVPAGSPDAGRQADIAAANDWQDALQQWAAGGDIDELFDEEAMQLLAERADNRLNINQATRQELEELPFLTAAQVEAIMEYLYRYAPMRSLSELLVIREIDWNTRRLLTFFVYAGEEKPKSVWPNIKDVARHGRHTLTGNIGLPLYTRKGFKATSTGAYHGYKLRHDVRYQFSYGNSIKFGITGAQDAGEPFFTEVNGSGYDHYNYYFQLRDIGRLQALNAGMYKVHMGMGLVAGSAFNMGKQAAMQGLTANRRTLTAHSSRSQAGYMRGLAASVAIGRQWLATAFVSQRSVDATLNSDGSVRTLLTDGYHRTTTEISKKNNTRQTDVGGSITWSKGAAHVSGNMVCTSFDRPLNPQAITSLYRRYAPSGRNFVNVSADYSFTNARLTIAGETAINREKAVAALHMFNVRLSNSVSMTALHRYYDKRYTALHASSLSEGSGIQNEHGVYAAIAWRPDSRWSLRCYADYAHFSWPRYRVGAASEAVDINADVRHTAGSTTLEGRYRYRLRQQNNSENTMLVNLPAHRLRLRLMHTAGRLSMQTQADAVSTQTLTESQRGIIVSQQASWKGRRFRAAAFAAWFRSDGYEARLYQYEPTVAYNYSFPAYYGHGIRYSLMLHTDIGRQLSLTAKAGVTNYFDRSSISTGMQQVEASSMADILMQLRWKF